jgi:hypothetical protein
MLCVCIGWTVAQQQAYKALEKGVPNKGAGIAVLFLIYFYSVWYNIGNNALTYSTPPFSLLPSPSAFDTLFFIFLISKLTPPPSLPNRTLPLRRALPRHRHRTTIRSRRLLLHEFRKSNRH